MTRAVAPPTPPAASIDAMAGALEQLLRAQLGCHHQLLTCLDDKRLAIRTANIDRITKICGDENAIVQRLAEIEKHRLDLTGQLTQAVRPKADQPLSIAEIAAATTEAQGTRLMALAAELRAALTELRRQSSIVRHAAEALSRHMSGIVQTVHSALSRARVYGNHGKINLGAPLQSIVDIKS